MFATREPFQLLRVFISIDVSLACHYVFLCVIRYFWVLVVLYSIKIDTIVSPVMAIWLEKQYYLISMIYLFITLTYSLLLYFTICLLIYPNIMNFSVPI